MVVLAKHQDHGRIVRERKRAASNVDEKKQDNDASQQSLGQISYGGESLIDDDEMREWD
jgi:hypothetical protein